MPDLRLNDPHVGQDRLCGEELVSQIDVHPLIPISGGNLFDGFPVIIASIVDEGGKRPGQSPQIGNGLLQLFDIRDIGLRK